MAGAPLYYEPPTPFAEQRSELRAAFSRDVGDRLDHTPALWKLTSSRERPVQLYVQGNFLSADECSGLCSRIDAGSYPSDLYNKEQYADVRTSYSCNLDVHDPFVTTIERRICDLLGIDSTHGEPLQGQRYQPGQQFREHADFFYIDEPYWAEYGPRGGQRTWTAMIFLKEPDSGGATRFGLLDLGVAPVAGRLLVWNNMAMDGSPNPWTQHEGQPVGDGTKYIVTKWFREGRFV